MGEREHNDLELVDGALLCSCAPYKPWNRANKRVIIGSFGPQVAWLILTMVITWWRPQLKLLYRSQVVQTEWFEFVSMIYHKKVCLYFPLSMS